MSNSYLAALRSGLDRTYFWGVERSRRTLHLWTAVTHDGGKRTTLCRLLRAHVGTIVSVEAGNPEEHYCVLCQQQAQMLHDSSRQIILAKTPPTQYGAVRGGR